MPQAILIIIFGILIGQGIKHCMATHEKTEQTKENKK